MKLKAYGIFIVAKEIKTQKGTFIVNEHNKAEILSVGYKVKNLNKGDIVYYQPNTAEAIQEYVLLREECILCKEVKE
tara:strand:+ start:1018 stop:1248 length:231 start_codon:yes stop_codon:yes gene_type:complete